MVRGLELFQERFKAFADRYVLIGGTACDLILEGAGLHFRATKDLDIVLCLESRDAAFGRTFWEFVNAGGYKIQESAKGKGRFYRFQKPVNEAYPAMLELFSRAPGVLPVAKGSHLSPIPLSDEISSLSAILLDADYYAWIQAGKRMMGDLPIVGPEHLIPLKARAWLDLRTRKNAGEDIDSDAIRKHKNDVFRLFQVIDPASDVKPPPRIVDDMRAFLDQVAIEGADMKSLGLRTISFQTVMIGLRKLYRVDLNPPVSGSRNAGR
jgi:hypothetical protein